MRSLPELLEALKSAIDAIPDAVINGRRDGPLASYLSPKLTTDEPPRTIFPSCSNPDDSSYEISTRNGSGFYSSRETTPHLQNIISFVAADMVLSGLILAHTWAAHYIGKATAKEDSLDLFRLRLETLLALIPVT
jgi:hypothetical protein